MDLNEPPSRQEAARNNADTPQITVENFIIINSKCVGAAAVSACRNYLNAKLRKYCIGSKKKFCPSGTTKKRMTTVILS